MNKALNFAKRHSDWFFLMHLFWFEVARTLPHAILAIFLINKFQADGSIVLALQIIYYVAIFCFEIPSGFLSDIFNRKKIFLASVCAMIIAFPLIGFADWLWLVFVGQFFYGVSSALSSGTVDLSILEQYEDEGQKKNFLAKKRMVFFGAAIVGGGLGPFVFNGIYNFLYLVSTSFFIISLFFGLLIIINEQERLKNENQLTYKEEVKQNIKLNLGYFKNKNYLFLFIGILAPIFIFGPFYNYWPVFYQANGLDSQYFGIVYVVFQVLGLICSYINKKMPLNKIYLFGAIIFASLIFVLTIVFLKGNNFIYVFPLFLFFANYYSFEMENVFHKHIKKNTGSSQVSILSSISSFFSFSIYIILFVFALQININTASIIGGALFGLIGLLSLFLVKFKTKSELEKSSANNQSD